MHHRLALSAIAAIVVAGPVLASSQSTRDLLWSAAFEARDKTTALAALAQAEASATATLRTAPNDPDAQLYRAMAIGYRAKLTKSRKDAITARDLFKTLASTRPADPEAQAAIGGWHIDAVSSLGGMLAGAILGAHKADGLAALDRSVQVSGGRAMFPALDALMRMQLDAGDTARALQLAQQASKAQTPSSIDRIMQKNAIALLVPLRAGDGKAAQAHAKRLLPFGRITG